VDDPLLRLEVHASTVDLHHALLSALEAMSDGGAGPALTAAQRSYLAQAMDIAADLDIVFGELTDALVNPADPNAVEHARSELASRGQPVPRDPMGVPQRFLSVAAADGDKCEQCGKLLTGSQRSWCGVRCRKRHGRVKNSPTMCL
jgi:hypothetical protein